MVKKTAKELLDIFFSNKEIQRAMEQYKKEFSPFVRLSHEYEPKKGIHSYRLFCPKCKKEFPLESTASYLGSEFFECPNCGYQKNTIGYGRLLNSGTEGASHSMICELGPDEYLFATLYIAREYKEEEKDVKIHFIINNISYFNKHTSEKISYRLKDEERRRRISEAIESSSPKSLEFQRTTRQFSSLYGSLMYKSSLAMFVLLSTSFEKEIDRWDKCTRIIHKIDLTSTTKIATPAKLKISADITDCPEYSEVDFFGITEEVTKIDYDSGREDVKYTCLACGHKWADNRHRWQNNIVSCPVCNTEKSRTGTKTVCYLKEHDDVFTLKIARYSASIDDKKIRKTLLRYYEITKASGKIKKTIIDFSEREPKRRNKPIGERVSEVVIIPSKKIEYTGINEYCSQKEHRHQAYSESDLFTLVTDSLLYPVVEKILKAGYGEEYLYAKDALSGHLDMSADNVYAAFKMPKRIFKAYKSLSADANDFYTFKALFSLQYAFPEVTTEEAIWCIKHSVYNGQLNSIIDIVPDLTLSECIRYLERVRLTQMYKPESAVIQWRDYLRAAKSIEMDMHDRHVLYPRALKTEHDVVVAKRKFVSDKATQERFNSAKEEYKSLEYHKGDYFIRLPASTEEMLEEGRKLHHCCGSYIDDVAEKSAYVLFLRKKADPETPFLTMEIIPVSSKEDFIGRIRQVRGLNDSLYSTLPEYREITNFLNDFAKAKHLALKLI